MIHKLSFTNFYSFKDTVTIDFVVDKNAPDTDSYFTDAYGERISKIMTIVGANASGKTNLLKSVVFLKWFIINSFTGLAPKDNISRRFKPFLFRNQKEVSSFEIIFEIVDEIYEYKLELTNERVIKEGLRVKSKETKKWSAIFDRQFKEGTKEYETNFGKLDVPSDFDKIVRENSSVLSAARQINNPYAVKIVDYFSKIQSNIDEADTPNKSNSQSIYSATEFFQNKPEMKEKAEKILQRFDLGISKVSIQKFFKADSTPIYIPMAHHKHSDNDQESALTIFEESGGTRNLFVLLKDILAALETGDTVVFDELDNNLHPLMVPEIINLFRSKNHNPKNAQIFFSTHNVQILNELDKPQIVIVEKNEKNISEAWKLTDIEGVRPDDNYYAKYLAGVYGGIPKF
ncbi:MAG: ATP-binding protein [Patescibacteria group bacterium]